MTIEEMLIKRAQIAATAKRLEESTQRAQSLLLQSFDDDEKGFHEEKSHRQVLADSRAARKASEDLRAVSEKLREETKKDRTDLKTVVDSSQSSGVKRMTGWVVSKQKTVEIETHTGTVVVTVDVELIPSMLVVAESKIVPSKQLSSSQITTIIAGWGLSASQGSRDIILRWMNIKARRCFAQKTLKKHAKLGFLAHMSSRVSKAGLRSRFGPDGNAMRAPWT